MQCTEVRFASFLSSGFISVIVVIPPERKPLCNGRTPIFCCNCHCWLLCLSQTNAKGEKSVPGDSAIKDFRGLEATLFVKEEIY